MRSSALLNGVGIVAALTLGGDWFVPVTTVLHAQTKAFVGGMIGMNLEPPGEAGNRFLDVGLGGNSLAGGVSTGLSISPKVSFAVEATFAGALTEHQRGRISGGIGVYERTHKDAIVSGVVRYRLSSRFAVVGGAGLVRSTTSESRTELLSDIAPGRVEGPFFREYHHTSLGVVGGFDVIVARWSRGVVAPSLRLHWFDQDDGDISTRLGLGVFVARPGVNVEVHF